MNPCSRLVAFPFVLLVVFIGGALAGQDAGSPAPGLAQAVLSKLPVCFVENRGVYPDEVRYWVSGADKTLFFTPDGITFRLRGTPRGWVVRLEFVGARSDVEPRGEDRQEAVFSYFRGAREDWKAGLPTCARLVYPDLWPGIDLVYTGTVNELKYAFEVKPGADPARIRLRYRGADTVAVTQAGSLRVETPAGGFEDARPVAFQATAGGRREIALAFALDPATGAFGFEVGDYDRTKLLVLDPAILVYCGYIGGSLIDAPTPVNCAVAVDAAGAAYVVGATQSNEQTFPVAVGPDVTHNGGYDAFVAKVNAAGTGLVYCGYIGGTSSELGYGIAVDAAGPIPSARHCRR